MKAVFSMGQTDRKKGEKLPLSIVSCGSYKEVDQKLETFRTNGTVDFHLLFTVHGVIESMGRRCTDGQCLLFLPREHQEYTYCIGEGTLYYWVHFVGTEAESFFKENVPRQWEYNAHEAEVNTLLPMMLNAAINKTEYAVGYAETLLRALLMALTAQKTINRFGKVIKMMKDFSKTYTLREYAAVCNQSEGHFIRTFKKEMGFSPMAYRTHLQIEHAKQLLIRTSLHVASVAELSGFHDSMYFSRIFRKETGLSPVKYRQNFT